jgi:hypothetical protein
MDDSVRGVLFCFLVALVACGRSGLGDVDAEDTPGESAAPDAGVAIDDAGAGPTTIDDDAGQGAEASVDPASPEDADVPLECPIDAGGTLLDTSDCAAREVVACAPPPGETVQGSLDSQIFGGNCLHHEGAGGFTVRFDPRGCALEISGGSFSACDVAWLASQRFQCAEGHPCAVAPSLVK